MPIEQWKVLLIDDNEGIRKVMSVALEDAGYSVMTAVDGETGIALCSKYAPHIVITDIRMPGIDGIEVLKRIKQSDPEKEVIVTTAYGEMEYAIQALQHDASDFITKPISDSALWVAMERAKERYKTRNELRDYTVLLEEKWLNTAEELAKTFNFQQKLIESSIDGIIGCDRGGKLVVFNKSMEQMLGYSKDKVIDKMSLYQLFSLGEWEKFKKILYSEECGGKNQLFLFDTTLISKAGNKIPVQLSASVLFQEDEEIGIVGFFRDLRRIRMLEQQFADQARLLHQDKMVSLGKLAASVVHEINNPLAGVLNYIRLMIKILSRNSVAPDQLTKFQGYLTLMESEISRCSEIVSNLLAFSRKSRLEFSRVDVNELLKKCVMLSGHRLTLQNITLTTSLDPHMSPVLGDFNQLQQCILNLIFNATDAMPEGGNLTIESTDLAKQGLIEIVVKDTGRGISAEDIRRIFDPFFTTKKEGKGLGLGLSVVYGIIDRHKGTINVASEPDHGTSFAIKLPACTHKNPAL